MKANLSRQHRSLIAKLKCGVLPLAIETGRFKNTPREIRFCRVCDDKKVETEYHHLLHCEKLNHVRSQYKAELLDMIKKDGDPDDEVVKRMLSNEYLKITGSYLQAMGEARSDSLYTIELQEANKTTNISN